MKRSSTLIITLAATAGLFLGACSDSKGGSSGDFCTLARAFEASQSETDNIFSGTGTADDIKKSFDTLQAQISAMVNAAPAEIKKDTQTVQAAMKTLQGVFEKAGYDMAKLASDPEAIKQLEVVSSDEVTTASDNITTYLDDTCGITPTT